MIAPYNFSDDPSFPEGHALPGSPVAGQTQAVSAPGGAFTTPPSTAQAAVSAENHGAESNPTAAAMDATTDPQTADDPAASVLPSAKLSESEEYRIAEANRRRELLLTFNVLIETHTKAEAVRQLGESYTTLWRWQKAFAKDGFNGLLPSTDKCGRKSVIEKLGVTQSTIDEIRGINLDTQSTTAALRVFAQSDRCPESLANVILDTNRSSKHALPPSLRRLVTNNRNLALAHQGPRALSLKGIWTPRKMDILPGDIFCSDDTTPIWGWWVPWPESEDHPFGCKLLQGQLLPVIDVASQKVLNFALIAREKSSYRACDIWSLFGHTFETWGLPRLGWQLERGSWEANLIAGQPVEYQEHETTLNRRVGGLRQLPTNITAWHREKLGDFPFPKTLQTWTSYLPKSKSIEAWFNRSQTLEGCLWGCLGRDQMRQPFEKAKKQFEHCSRPRAKEDPRHHFLSQEEMVSRLVKIMNYLDNEPMEGEVFRGVPATIFESARQQYPLLKLPEELRWLYRRNWKVTPINRGWARIRGKDEITGLKYSLFYNSPLFADHEGKDVIVYYDRENFEEPAQVLLAQPSGTYAAGEYLCEAQYFERPGSFMQGDKTGHDVRKAFKDRVMTAYGVIAQHAPSRQLPPEIAARREAAKLENLKPAPAPSPSITSTASLPSTRPVGPTAIATAAASEREREPSADLLQRRRARLAAQAQRALKLMEIS